MLSDGHTAEIEKLQYSLQVFVVYTSQVQDRVGGLHFVQDSPQRRTAACDDNPVGFYFPQVFTNKSNVTKLLILINISKSAGGLVRKIIPIYLV